MAGEEEPARRLGLFYAYGDVMWELQLLEMDLWLLLSSKLLTSEPDENLWDKFTGWTDDTLGRLVRAADLPGEVGSLAKAVNKSRNYLAHHFLRDNVWLLGREGHYNDMLEYLRDTYAMVKLLSRNLRAYAAQSLGTNLDEVALTDEELRRILDEENTQT